MLLAIIQGRNVYMYMYSVALPVCGHKFIVVVQFYFYEQEEPFARSANGLLVKILG